MRSSGLTLIELLVAMFLLAVLSVMGYRGVSAMIRADDHVTATSERWQAVSLFFERFAADVTQPAGRAVRDNAGNLIPSWWGRLLREPDGPDAQLELTRKSPPGQDDVRVGYRLRAGTIELLAWPALDRSPVSRAEVHPLLEQVADMRLRYLDAQGRWQDAWPVAGVNEPLPRAVSIEVTLGGDAPISVQRIFALP